MPGRRKSARRHRNPSLGRGFGLALLDEAVLLQLVVERRGLDAQKARRLRLDAPGLLVGLVDELALEVLEDLRQRAVPLHHREGAGGLLGGGAAEERRE